jgi:HK97 family phage prohead protease
MPDKLTQDKEQRSNKIKVEVRAVGEGEGQKRKIVGYAVKWDQLSDPIWGYFQERFRKGAFANYLSRSDADVVASWQHNLAEILGRTPGTLTVEEDDIGLRYEIDPPSWADKHIETIERGDVTGSSFIFRALKSEWDETNPEMEIRTVVEAELIEVSPVTFPAYPQSEAGIRSAKDVYQDYKKLKEQDHKREWQTDISLENANFLEWKNHLKNRA